MNNCRGCLRYSLKSPAFYEFNADPGWEPAQMIIDTDRLNELLKLFPRTVHHLDVKEPVLQAFVDSHEIFPEHIDHVDETIPILLGECRFTKGQEKQLFHLCNDGHHRIAKCIRLGIDVPFYMFTALEMSACSFLRMSDYLRAQGVYVLGASDKEINQLFGIDVK